MALHKNSLQIRSVWLEMVVGGVGSVGGEGGGEGGGVSAQGSVAQWADNR